MHYRYERIEIGYTLKKTNRVETNRVLVPFENHTFVWFESESLWVSREGRVLGFGCIRVPSQSGFFSRNCLVVLVDYRVFSRSEVRSERMFRNAMLQIWSQSSEWDFEGRWRSWSVSGFWCKPASNFQNLIWQHSISWGF